jgi:hypothetical protein
MAIVVLDIVAVIDEWSFWDLRFKVSWTSYLIENEDL